MTSVRPHGFELVSKVLSARAEEPGLRECARMSPDRALVAH
jgi:hypothetical protein